jgi:hypothetical protein
MQVSSVDALSSISAQQSQLQKMNTAALSYQVKLNGDTRNAVIEKTTENYRGYISGVAGVSVDGASLIAAENNLAARIIDLQV